ncbi:hypothetical protein PI125_g3073 [Phytophthora idaei]|nr:hypothetical protein PI125_g3073 [Phytophthora idaei]KAG3168587.1 hypothetical protein PI126_g3235 [Phytophthora idaei]
MVSIFSLFTGFFQSVFRGRTRASSCTQCFPAAFMKDNAITEFHPDDAGRDQGIKRDRDGNPLGNGMGDTNMDGTSTLALRGTSAGMASGREG